ncbi:unnamed protein product [Durusdinium trenchii]|uniref:RNase H type-1 domain-containing protein n=2 Tax=Durusdinium trenchii TaxID=1381693 RepID=A0ABP0HSY0_9DINO
MLYECAACIEHCGPVAEAWIRLCCRPESQHFWLRGLVPRAWTTAEPITSEEVVRAGYFLDPAAFEGQETFFATDGSGGPFTKDPRLRKCAWSVVAVSCVDDEFVLIGSITGRICDDGNLNTVARAELRAFLELLRFLPDTFEALVVVDAAFVINVYLKLKRKPHKISNPHGDLRAGVAAHLSKRVLLTKVRSHLTLAKHLSKGDEAWSWHTNKFADEFATITAQSVAPYAKATGWVLGRVTRLTAWMLPRIRYWFTAESTAPKVSTWKCTKKEFFTQALVKRFGGHNWVPFEKGLRCTKCPTVLKRIGC